MSQDRFAPSENGTHCSTASQLLAEFQLIEQVWGKAEKKLAETHVPVDVRVKIREGSIDGEHGNPIGCFAEYLSYGKVNGNRRICWVYSSWFGDGSEESDCRPVVECPVDTRIEMFDHFRELYRQAESVAKSYVPKLREAREKFEQTLKWVAII